MQLQKLMAIRMLLEVSRQTYCGGNHILVVDQTGMIQMVSTGDVVRAVASERRDKLNRFNAYIKEVTR